MEKYLVVCPDVAEGDEVTFGRYPTIGEAQHAMNVAAALVGFAYIADGREVADYSGAVPEAWLRQV